MSDIDFDELDRAVSSLMGQHDQSQKNESSAESTAERSTVTAAERSTDTSVPERDFTSRDSLSHAASSQPVAPRETRPAISRRSAGRFMDVMTPSAGKSSPSALTMSDMRPPSRHSGHLQPLDVSRKTEQPSSVPEDNIIQDTSSSNVPEPAVSTDSSQSPMESPFLNDISVDKRPLGSSSQQGSSVPVKDEETSHAFKTEPSSEEPILDPIADWQALQAEEGIGVIDNVGAKKDDPWVGESEIESNLDTLDYTRPELSAEVVALESKEVEGVTSAPVPAEKTATPVVAAAKSNEKNVAKDTPAAVSIAETKPNQPADIPAQYKPSDVGAPEPSAIFDSASEDPLPLKHAEKKNSGWMVLVGILGLLVIGVVGGVLVWNFLIK